jgi:hypothetical protein
MHFQMPQGCWRDTLTSGFLVWSSLRDAEDAEIINAATKAYLDAAHNLRLAADAIPALRNSRGLLSDLGPKLTTEEWAIVRSLQVLYGVDRSSRRDPNTLPLAHEEPVFHPEASFKNARELRQIAPLMFGEREAESSKRLGSFSTTSALLADALIEALKGEQISADEIDRDRLIAAIERRYVLTKEARRRDLEPTLDLIQAAWDLTDLEVEELLAAPAGWLAAWRIHEAPMDLRQFEFLSSLISLHEAMRLHVKPKGYGKWLKRRWKPASITQGRSPLEMMLSGGQDAIKSLTAYLTANAL